LDGRSGGFRYRRSGRHNALSCCAARVDGRVGELEQQLVRGRCSIFIEIGTHTLSRWPLRVRGYEYKPKQVRAHGADAGEVVYVEWSVSAAGATYRRVRDSTPALILSYVGVSCLCEEKKV